MHLRGKDMSFTARTPGGKDETLLIIPNYNPPRRSPTAGRPAKKTFAKGTEIVVAHYDNSAFNPCNPDTESDGAETARKGAHEMMVGFIFFYTPMPASN